MKRLWVSAGILVILLITCTFGLIQTKKISKEMIQTLTSAKMATNEGDSDTALKLSQKAIEDWKHSHKILCTFMQHDKLESIDETLAGLPMLSYYRASDAFAADCDRGIAQIQSLNDSEIISIENVL